MKTLRDIIRVQNPEDIWFSIYTDASENRREQADAFVEALKMIADAEPERIPAVLLQAVRLERDEFLDSPSVFLVKQAGEERTASLRLGKDNLPKILELYVPDSMPEVCVRSAVRELFRVLIAEELGNKKYMYRHLRANLRRSLRDKRRWEAVCSRNAADAARAGEAFADGTLNEKIREEYTTYMPELGNLRYWHELTGHLSFDRQRLEALFPENMPSFEGLCLLRDRILEKTGKMVKKLSARPDREADPRMQMFREQQLRRMKARADCTLVVEEIPGCTLPAVYVVKKNGQRRAVCPSDESRVMDFALAVCPSLAEKRLEDAVLFACLYLQYPLRMNRELWEHKNELPPHLAEIFEPEHAAEARYRESTHDLLAQLEAELDEDLPFN